MNNIHWISILYMSIGHLFQETRSWRQLLHTNNAQGNLGKYVHDFWNSIYFVRQEIYVAWNFLGFLVEFEMPRNKVFEQNSKILQFLRYLQVICASRIVPKET